MILDENLFQDYRKPLRKFTNHQKSINEALCEPINESANESSGKATLYIEVMSGLNADGFIATIKDKVSGNDLFKHEYYYGYDASYNRGWASSKKPFVTDIINSLKKEYNVEDVEVTAGKNIFRGDNVSNDSVEKFKNKYLNESINLSEEQLDKAMELVDEIYEACKSIYSYNKNGKFEEGLNLNRWSIYAAAIDLHDLIEHESINESKSINEAARNKNSHKYFALMSYDFDPESGPDADRFSVSDVGQFSSKKEAEDNWRDILSKDRWAYVTEISEDEYNDHQELIKFYNEHPGYMDYEYCTKVVNQFKDALRSKDQEGARAVRKELSSIGYSNEEIGTIEKEALKEAFDADRVQKRIACTTEFDNGHVFHNDYFRASSAEAEEMARQKSIENPGKVFYVKYDNVMEPCSDIKWKNGKKINESKSTDLEDAVFTKNRYDDKIYYHGFMDKKDADRHYPDRLKTKTYWYSTKHGVMPGSVPRGINILDVRDIGNKSYFKTDSIISSKDLKYYDITEDIQKQLHR